VPLLFSSCKKVLHSCDVLATHNYHLCVRGCCAQTVQAAKAAVAVCGCIVALLAVVERTMATVKQVSDSVNYLTVGQAPKDKIGFQHEVGPCMFRVRDRQSLVYTQ
jgi:hypothetical protein